MSTKVLFIFHTSDTFIETYRGWLSLDKNHSQDVEYLRITGTQESFNKSEKEVIQKEIDTFNPDIILLSDFYDEKTETRHGIDIILPFITMHFCAINTYILGTFTGSTKPIVTAIAWSALDFLIREVKPIDAVRLRSILAESIT